MVWDLFVATLGNVFSSNFAGCGDYVDGMGMCI